MTQNLDWIDWVVLISTLLAIVGYGTWKTKNSSNSVQDYVRGGNSSKWWTIGLSVMATQASAITFLSTTGQAFSDGMGFVQFYFGLPIAMVIICLVFIPLYHRLKVYTAYEFLENRFDLKTRSLAAILFLIQRGLAAGITIFAPAIILSVVLGWPIIYLNITIGILVIIYTVSGGTKAVTVTQKQQMQFNQSPLNFIDVSTKTVLKSEYAQQYQALQEKQALNKTDATYKIKQMYWVFSCSPFSLNTLKPTLFLWQHL